MAFDLSDFAISLEAAADLSANQFFGVVYTATGLLVVSTLGGHMTGILQNDPDALDETGAVMVSGISKWEAGAAIPKSVPITVDAAGKVIQAMAGHIVHGTALEASAADGDIIPVLLTTNGYIFV